MSKSIIIVGMGPGLSMGVAEKFGKEGFSVGMISRTESKLAGYRDILKKEGIESFYATADIANERALEEAIASLKANLGTIDVLVYNAVDYRMKPLMEETADDLAAGFRISVAHVLVAVKSLLDDLKRQEGAVLLTGGGSGQYPSPDMASISLGKAGIRNLALQLHEVLKQQKVYVGTLQVNGAIDPGSASHSPAILADKFWQMYLERKQAELIY